MSYSRLLFLAALLFVCSTGARARYVSTPADNYPPYSTTERAPATTAPSGKDLAVRTAALPATTPQAKLGPGFDGEEDGKSRMHPGLHVIHLKTDLERDAYRVVVKDGLVYSIVVNRDGSLSAKLHDPATHLFDFVLDLSGNLYLINDDDPLTKEVVPGTAKPQQRMRHSSIEDGNPVAAAGGLTMRNDKIEAVNIDSGHYGKSETAANLDTLRTVLAPLTDVTAIKFHADKTELTP